MPAVLFVCLPVGRIRASAPTERGLPVPHHDAEPVLQALGVGTRPKDPEAVQLFSQAIISTTCRTVCRTTAGIRGIARERAAVVGDMVRPVAPHLDHSVRRQHCITLTLSSQGNEHGDPMPSGIEHVLVRTHKELRLGRESRLQ